MKKAQVVGVYGIALIIMLGGALSIGYYYGRNEAQAVQIPATVVGATVPLQASTTDFAVFWRVWNLLDEKFASTKKTQVTDQEKLYGAIKGLTEAYGDPYTTFFPPAEAKEFESEIEGNFEGVGMEVSMKEGVLTVVAPLKDSPAQRAGIRAGDKILKIDKTVTSNLTVDQAIKLIRGAKGTTVMLVVLHTDAQSPVDISIVRDVINIPVLESKSLGNGIYHIRLFSFSAQSSRLFKDAIEDFVRSGNKKLILDLRGNPGGYLDAAVSMASWFLPVGNVVVTEEFKGNAENIYHRSRGHNIVGPEYKIVILVDGGSASASEILAGALREYDRATLIGTKTFGKGSVQEYLKVTPETSLKVTVARWLTPKGVSISEGGLTPDIEVPMTAKDVEIGRDPQLEKAKEILTK